MLQEGRDLHIDAVLSNIMVGRRPQGYIADDLIPVINVGKQSDVYYKSNYKEAVRWTPDLTRRAKFAKSREVYFSVSSDTYFAQNYALSTRWSDEDIVNEDSPIKLRMRSARQVTDQLKIDYEARIAALANVTANVATLTSVATPWSNTTGSRPFDDLSNLIELFRVSTSLRPNRLIVPEQHMTYLRRSDQIRDMLFGDRGGIATDDQIAALFKIERILVPEILVNTAGVLETKIGSGTLSPVWDKKAWLAYVGDIQGGEESDTWISAFRWTDPIFGTPWAVRAFPHNDERRSQKVEAAYYQGEKVVSPDLAIAINSI